MIRKEDALRLKQHRAEYRENHRDSRSSIVPFTGASRAPRRRRYRRLDELPSSQLSPTEQAEVDHLLLEDQVATLIDRVPDRLLGMMLHLMSNDDLVLLDIVANGLFWNGDDEMRNVAVLNAAKRRNRRSPRGQSSRRTE
jgi:hypothetical protein